MVVTVVHGSSFYRRHSSCKGARHPHTAVAVYMPLSHAYQQLAVLDVHEQHTLLVAWMSAL